MSWVEVFAVLVVSHLVGDFLLQTDWQATNKYGGLGADPAARRALLRHLATYTLAFVPALIWLGDRLGASVLAAAVLIGLAHVIQDDGRLVTTWIASVKRGRADPGSGVFITVDQAFHVLVLLFTALVVAA